MNKKQLIENVVEKLKKYEDLIWYVRTTSENYDIKGVKENVDRIEKQYPDEVKELSGLNTEHANWHHGFNSGMIAALRYILTMDDLGLEQADEEFPMLDS
jgi:hypothetical protein